MLAEETVLSDDFLRQLINVGEVDLLVALPTLNRAGTIEGAVRAVRRGLLNVFPRERAVLLIADGGSRDDSVDIAIRASASLPADARLQSLRTFHTVTGLCDRGMGTPSFLRLLLTTADLVRAKACAVISPSASISPDWIERLLAPIYFRNFDLSLPLYRRHKFDGLLLRILLYPMVRALWGKRIREPYCTDFGFSQRLGPEHFLNQELPKAETSESATELVLTLSALMHGFRTCEVFLGPKEEAEHAPDIVAALRRTMGTLFCFIDSSEAQWGPIQGSEPVASEGGQSEITSEHRRINPARMYEMFRSGVHDLQPILSSVLSVETLTELTRCANHDREVFQFPDELWVRTVYEFASSYHKSVISRDHIIQAMAPLYRGKIYEFLSTNRQATAHEIEARVEAICMAFEQHKPYLLQQWDGRGGGNL